MGRVPEENEDSQRSKTGSVQEYVKRESLTQAERSREGIGCPDSVLEIRFMDFFSSIEDVLDIQIC